MSAAQLRGVYRLAWRESTRCQDYSTRHFIRRKIREAFRGGVPASGLPSATPAHALQSGAQGGAQLDEIRRVVDLTNTYHGAADGMKSSVMENAAR
jgi:hypothetical protein